MVATMAQAMQVGPEAYERSPGSGFRAINQIERDDLWAIDYEQNRVNKILPDIRM